MLPNNMGIYSLAAGLMALLALVGTEAALFQSSSSSSSAGSITTSIIRMRATKLRRPDLCRENLPRKPEDLPVLVITGRVKEIYLAGGGGDGEQTSAGPNKALVTVGRVIKGNQQLLGTDIIVAGFNATNSTTCPNYVAKQNDTLILLLNHEAAADRRYSLQANSILSMSLQNLDRVNGLAADEPIKRRPPIEDILCEAHYCAYGRCAVANEQLGQVSCRCPDICPANYSPVCGSNNVTYSNECQLIMEGCRQKRPLFVTRETSCQL